MRRIQAKDAARAKKAVQKSINQQVASIQGGGGQVTQAHDLLDLNDAEEPMSTVESPDLFKAESQQSQPTGSTLDDIFGNLTAVP